MATLVSIPVLEQSHGREFPGWAGRRETAARRIWRRDRPIRRSASESDCAEPVTVYPMPRLIESPTVVQAAGNLPKRIEEYAGRVNTGHEELSVARMVSPEGWVEPG